MPLQDANSSLNIVAVAAVVLVLWYAFQVGSRKRQELRLRIRRIIIALSVYLVGVYVLTVQGLPLMEVVAIALLAGMGCAWLFVETPKRGRRIPTPIRRQVIDRDLTSNGLKWDASKYHIDHTVPFSRGGDHSARNLRVVDKRKNLRKGGKMPRLFDFLRK